MHHQATMAVYCAALTDDFNAPAKQIARVARRNLLLLFVLCEDVWIVVVCNILIALVAVSIRFRKWMKIHTHTHKWTKTDCSLKCEPFILLFSAICWWNAKVSARFQLQNYNDKDAHTDKSIILFYSTLMPLANVDPHISQARIIEG